MNKGEMLWYESARLEHGRPQPLEGKMYEDDYDDEDDWDEGAKEKTCLIFINKKHNFLRFDNIFLHFRPLGDSWYPLSEQPMAAASMKQ